MAAKPTHRGGLFDGGLSDPLSVTDWSEGQPFDRHQPYVDSDDGEPDTYCDGLFHPGVVLLVCFNGSEHDLPGVGDEGEVTFGASVEQVNGHERDR